MEKRKMWSIAFTTGDISLTFFNYSLTLQPLLYKHQFSPQQYKTKLERIFEKGKLEFKVHDLFAIPDYTRLFQFIIDKKLSAYTKTDNTQLAWRFIAVPRSELYPLGVMTHYRAYASDAVYEIVEDNSGLSYIGWKAIHTLVSWQPRESVYNHSGGMYILKRLPSEGIYPSQFKKGSHEELQKAIDTFKRLYQSRTDYIAEWEEFAAHEAPKSDDVYEYLELHENKFHVPLLENLFGNLPLRNRRTESNSNYESDDDPADVDVFNTTTVREFTESISPNQIQAMDSVQWSNRGTRLPFIPPRLVVNEESIESEQLRRRAAYASRDYTQLPIRELKSICRYRSLPLAARNKAEYVLR
jgi:hypothetical protein